MREWFRRRMTATIIAAVTTILMGLVTNYPLPSGMGLNAALCVAAQWLQTLEPFSPGVCLILSVTGISASTRHMTTLNGPPGWSLHRLYR